MTADGLHRFTLADTFREHARDYPQRLAVVDTDADGSEVRLTWPQLDERIDRLCSALTGAGVGAGDVVLWSGQNSFRIIECLGAAAKLGAVLCVANWRQSADELRFVLEDSAPAVVVWQEAEVGEVVRTARAALDAASPAAAATWLRHDADRDDPDGYESFLLAGPPVDPEDRPEPVQPGLEDPVLMLYTAAFTGRPSGALLTHHAVIVQSLMMANLQRIDSGYRYLNSGPLFHVATFMTTLATLVMAGTNLFTPRVDAEEVCRLIEREGCTGAFLMGPTIEDVVALNAVRPDGTRPYDLSTLRTFRGAPEWNEMVTRDDSPWGTRPAGFGQTEVMGMLTYNAVGGDAEGSAGRASPLVRLRIVDPDGNEVAAGETGEIVAAGPQVMAGYRNRPEETERRQAGGWHHTSDLGRREPDGSISFVGPKGRIVKSAAENIYPAEVEGALNAHDAVRESAVIGVPDPTWGQSVRAIVVLHDGASASEDDLIEHVRSLVASYKKPRSVVFRTEPLPRLGWPIDYDALDAEYGGGGYPGRA